MAPSSKSYVSTGTAAPARTVSQHPFNHQVDLLLPSAVHAKLAPTLSSALAASPLHHHRLTVPLASILEPAFLTRYIKTGNILLLSQGRIATDNVYALSSGVLSLSLTRETYETSGLTGGIPARWGGGKAGGRKRGGRYLVSINLREPHMLHGRKGFERIVKAFQTPLLKAPITFLLCDLSQLSLSTPPPPSSSAPIPQPILSSPPRLTPPSLTHTPPLLIPDLTPPPGSTPLGGGTPATEYNREVWQDWALHVHEWLALVSLGPADRLKANGGRVDPLLSKYSVEGCGKSEGVTRVRIRGMIPAEWIEWVWGLVVGFLKQQEEGEDGEEWAAVCVHGFENAPISWVGSEHGNLGGGENGYTILRMPKKKEEAQEKFMTWEVVGSQDEYS